jgi:hypothetical protein
VHPRRAPPVFVCRKCLKRSDDAKTIARALKSEAKRHAGDREKPARVIKTSCFGICPKRAVVVTGGAAASRGDYVLNVAERSGATLIRAASAPRIEPIASESLVNSANALMKLVSPRFRRDHSGDGSRW